MNVDIHIVYIYSLYIYVCVLVVCIEAILHSGCVSVYTAMYIYTHFSLHDMTYINRIHLVCI